MSPNAELRFTIREFEFAYCLCVCAERKFPFAAKVYKVVDTSGIATQRLMSPIGAYVH